MSIRRGEQGELSVHMVKTDHTVHPLGTGNRQVNVTDGEVFAEKSELALVGSWNEMVISGDRQRAWLPALPFTVMRPSTTGC
ncbi:hypothetical protein [Stenotrophomonas indicatrix]|uniref:hypothetical protein n=1 Tax=Stenotrophomonas indicatrix TaxID=2045451 RepID=UPI000FDB85C5|nr:hypothetical protein [Stenotrophomonas indicatrix]